VADGSAEAPAAPSAVLVDLDANLRFRVTLSLSGPTFGLHRSDQVLDPEKVNPFADRVRIGLIGRLRRRDKLQSIDLTAIELAGGAHLAVVGESHYQDAIVGTVERSPLGSEEPDRHAFQAVLVREPRNKYDPNTIGVYSSVGKVGHLSREAAIEYGPVFEEIARQGAGAWVPSCRVSTERRRTGLRRRLTDVARLRRLERFPRPQRRAEG
jgi:hypothetical protein